jgi:hypothetical protein
MVAFLNPVTPSAGRSEGRAWHCPGPLGFLMREVDNLPGDPLPFGEIRPSASPFRGGNPASLAQSVRAPDC